MGGQACGVLSRVSFLLFPHSVRYGRGVAGWNTDQAFVKEVDGFGMLLGPEETPVGGVFLVAAPGPVA